MIPLKLAATLLLTLLLLNRSADVGSVISSSRKIYTQRTVEQSLLPPPLATLKKPYSLLVAALACSQRPPCNSVCPGAVDGDYSHHNIIALPPLNLSATDVITCWAPSDSIVECKPPPFMVDPLFGCYWISETEQDFAASQALCSSYEGGSLFSPATDDQMAKLLLYLQKAYPVPQTYMWMGVWHVGIDVWQFSDGRAVVPDLWCTGEPDSGSSSCGLVRHVTESRFPAPCFWGVADTSCTNLALAICQISPP